MHIQHHNQAERIRFRMTPRPPAILLDGLLGLISLNHGAQVDHPNLPIIYIWHVLYAMVWLETNLTCITAAVNISRTDHISKKSLFVQDTVAMIIPYHRYCCMHQIIWCCIVIFILYSHSNYINLISYIDNPKILFSILLFFVDEYWWHKQSWICIASLTPTISGT